MQTIPFGEFKVVLLDEADYISPNGQAALRGVMETYHASARFILTCNYPNRVIPALHSRLNSGPASHLHTVTLPAYVTYHSRPEIPVPSLPISSSVTIPCPIPYPVKP